MLTDVPIITTLALSSSTSQQSVEVKKQHFSSTLSPQSLPVLQQAPSDDLRPYTQALLPVLHGSGPWYLPGINRY